MGDFAFYHRRTLLILFLRFFFQVPYTLGKQVSFDVFAGMLYAFFHSMQDSVKLAEVQIKWAVSIAAAFLASLVACIFSQPGDMIVTETYRPQRVVVATGRQSNTMRAKGAASASKVATAIKPTVDNRSFADVIRTIYAAGGVSNFFTGTGARIVHVGVIITSQLVIYDIIKQLLGLPATGSH